MKGKKTRKQAIGNPTYILHSAGSGRKLLKLKNNSLNIKRNNFYKNYLLKIAPKNMHVGNRFFVVCNASRGEALTKNNSSFFQVLKMHALNTRY